MLANDGIGDAHESTAPSPPPTDSITNRGGVALFCNDCTVAAVSDHVFVSKRFVALPLASNPANATLIVMYGSAKGSVRSAEKSAAGSVTEGHEGQT
mgnify:CR=1 FL=1